ncbi:type-2 ice-structuring protein-like isoform X2 [Scomber japonicus]|uniref:type-2 ice-structuring protein-like isoform X2 n=1 Tax=Scomber japonicus TaxID=13676 RepID=UPI002305A9B9|nr:type-2 ice-structuring protein-like isoform X2 [Scomber japonicus]
MKMLAVSLLVCAMMALTMAEEALQIERSASCPGGWTDSNSRCFLFVSTSLTWADAEKHCQSHGGNLASVHSLEEHHMIQGVILKVTHSYSLAWLGGSDAQQEGTWFWSDGTPFSYTYWSRGQPDNRADAHCLLMNFGAERKFDDQPCSYRVPFVCAKRVKCSITTRGIE